MTHLKKVYSVCAAFVTLICKSLTKVLKRKNWLPLDFTDEKIDKNALMFVSAKEKLTKGDNLKGVTPLNPKKGYKAE